MSSRALQGRLISFLNIYDPQLFFQLDPSLGCCAPHGDGIWFTLIRKRGMAGDKSGRRETADNEKGNEKSTQSHNCSSRSPRKKPSPKGKEAGPLLVKHIDSQEFRCLIITRTRICQS